MNNGSKGQWRFAPGRYESLLRKLFVAVFVISSTWAARADLMVGSPFRNLWQYTDSGSNLASSSGLVGDLQTVAWDGAGRFFAVGVYGRSPAEWLVNEMAQSGTMLKVGMFLDTGPLYLAADTNDNLFVLDYDNGYVAELHKSGTPINTNLINGLSQPDFILLDGNGHLFIANAGNGTVGEYTTAGQTINAALITNLNNPVSLALDGQSNLYVLNNGSGTVGKYTAGGAALNASLITGLNDAVAMAVDESSNLYFALYGNNEVDKYTTTGALVSSPFISGVNTPDTLVYFHPQPGFGNVTNAGGTISITVTNLSPDETVVISSSPDLKNWTAFSTNVPSGTSLPLGNLHDPNSPTLYFRAMVQ